MNNQDYLGQVYNEAFKDEIEKIAGTVSEYIGGGLSTVAFSPAAAIGTVAAALTPTKTDAQMKKQQKKTWSNFIPGVGTYRAFKRMGHSQKRFREMNKK